MPRADSANTTRRAVLTAAPLAALFAGVAVSAEAKSALLDMDAANWLTTYLASGGDVVTSDDGVVYFGYRIRPAGRAAQMARELTPDHPLRSRIVEFARDYVRASGGAVL